MKKCLQNANSCSCKGFPVNPPSCWPEKRKQVSFPDENREKVKSCANEKKVFSFILFLEMKILSRAICKILTGCETYLYDHFQQQQVLKRRRKPVWSLPETCRKSDGTVSAGPRPAGNEQEGTSHKGKEEGRESGFCTEARRRLEKRIEKDEKIRLFMNCFQRKTENDGNGVAEIH